MPRGTKIEETLRPIHTHLEGPAEDQHSHRIPFLLLPNLPRQRRSEIIDPLRLVSRRWHGDLPARRSEVDQVLLGLGVGGAPAVVRYGVPVVQEEEVVEEGEEEVVECVQVGDEEGGRGGFLREVSAATNRAGVAGIRYVEVHQKDKEVAQRSIDSSDWSCGRRETETETGGS
jgi:hypothetical protein